MFGLWFTGLLMDGTCGILVVGFGYFWRAVTVIPCNLAKEYALVKVLGLNILTGIYNSSTNVDKKKLNT